MALKRNEEALLRALTNGAKVVSKFVKDVDLIRAEFADQIRELEQEAQIVLRFHFVGDELQIVVEDRSQDKVSTSFNTTNEKLLLRAQLNGVPIDVMLYRKGKKDPEPTLNVSNEQVANALAELSALVAAMPVSMVEAGNAKWSLVPGEAPNAGQADKNDDAGSEEDDPLQVTEDDIAAASGEAKEPETQAPVAQQATSLSQTEAPALEAEAPVLEEEAALG